MRVTILTVGSRGDVQPFLALSQGLREAGHDVTLATHGQFGPLIERHGLRFSAVEGNPKDLLQSEQGLAWLESGRNPLRSARRLLQLAQPLVAGLVRDAIVACRGAEVVIFSPLGAAGYHVAEAMGVPSVLAALAPASRTRYMPDLGAPAWNLGAAYNLITHIVAEQFAWQPLRKLVNKQRRDVLGLVPLPMLGPFRTPRWRNMPVLYGFSPSLAPKPSDWRKSYEVTGYWFPDPDPAWSPPPELLRFLDEEPTPVYVGFGSMPDRRPEELSTIVLEALRRARCRGVISAGWADLASVERGNDVLVIQDVPHDWLFPRMAAVVHHGGAGTTHAGLRAGLPTVVVPFLTDQPFWGRRVASLGVGPTPIPRRELSVDRLAAAIHTAVHDATVRARASHLGALIRSEAGVRMAVEALHRHLPVLERTDRRRRE